MSEIQTTEGTQPVATEQTTTATAQPILSSTQQQHPTGCHGPLLR